MCIVNVQWIVIRIYLYLNAQARYALGKCLQNTSARSVKQTACSACGPPAGTGSEERLQVPAVSWSFFGSSYLIRVCGSVSMEGGPLVRRNGLTNTPWPGGQRKYTLPWTVPLCLPMEGVNKILCHIWTLHIQGKRVLLSAVESIYIYNAEER